MLAVETVLSSHQQNPLVMPLPDYHGYLVETMNGQFPSEGAWKELALRVALVVTAPLAYLALALSACLGICLSRWFVQETVLVGEQTSPLQSAYFEQFDEILKAVLLENSVEIHAFARFSDTDTTLMCTFRLNQEFGLADAKEILRELVIDDGLDRIERDAMTGVVSANLEWRFIIIDSSHNISAYFVSTPLSASMNEITVETATFLSLMNSSELTKFQSSYFQALDNFIDQRVPEEPSAVRLLLDVKSSKTPRKSRLRLDETIAFDNVGGKEMLKAKMRCLSIAELIQLEKERGPLEVTVLWSLFVRDSKQQLHFLYSSSSFEIVKGKINTNIVRERSFTGKSAEEQAEFCFKEADRIYLGWEAETDGI